MNARTRIILLLLATVGTVAALAVPSMAAERGPAPWRNPDLTPEESRLLFMEHTARIDLDTASFQSFAIPVGHMLVGDVVDGEFRFGIAKLPDAAEVPSPNAALPLWNGAVDCENNDVPSWWEWETWHPVNYNLFWPLDRNTVGDSGPDYCANTNQYAGPITHFEFSWSGDYPWFWSYGGVDVYDYYTGSGFNVACSPSGAWTGAGVNDQWVYTFQGADTVCIVATGGVQPSQYVSWDAYVINAAVESGSAYAAFQ